MAGKWRPQSLQTVWVSGRYRALDIGNLALLTLLDLLAAFDSVDHATLIQRLQKSYGLAMLHSSGSHHTSVDEHSMSERLWPLPSCLQCCLEYPGFSPRTYHFCTLHCRCTAACERPRASASCICGWHADSWGMSPLRDRWAATPCIWLPGRCVIVDGS